MAELITNAMPPERKRTVDALHLREPDLVPIGLWGTIEGYQNLRKGIGMDFKADPKDYRTGSTTWTTDVSFELDIAEKLGVDFVRIAIGSPGGSPGFRRFRLIWVFHRQVLTSTSTNGVSFESGRHTSRVAIMK